MMSRDYKCFKCDNEFMELYENSSVAKNTAICPECGSKAKRLYGAQCIIDTWTPEGGHDNDAQRDIEHFDKLTKRGVGRAMYQEDRIKSEVYNKEKQDKLDGKEV